MGDNFTGPTGIPSPPLEIPTPDLPKANFVSIGADFEKGRRSVAKEGSSLPGWLDWLADAVGIIIGGVLNIFELVLAWFVKMLFKIWHGAEEGTSEIAAEAVGGMFGTPVSPGAFSSTANRGSREGVATSMVGAITSALGASFTGDAAVGIKPSSAGADKFLQTVTHMAVEGWLQGWLFELVSAGQVETFADLKDILERSLGLGRLARRVLGPPVKVFVEDPFTWKLNDLYRPTQLPPEIIVREYLRGIITQDEMNTAMGWHGFSNARLEALVNYNRTHLTAAELETLATHGVMTEDEARQKLKDQGYSDFDSAGKLEAIKIGRFQTLAEEYVRTALEGYAARKMDASTFQAIVDGSGLTDSQKTMLAKLGELKRSLNRTLFTVAEGEKLVEQGLWDFGKFHDLVIAHGYTEGDETDLELSTLSKQLTAAQLQQKKADAAKAKAAAALAKTQAAAAKAAAVKAAQLGKGVTLSKYETLVKDGVKTIADYRAFLTSKGIDAVNIEALATDLQAKLDTAASAAATKTTAGAALKAHNLTLAQLDQAAVQGAISIDEYRARVLAAGVSTDDADILVTLLNDQIAGIQAKAQAKADAQALAATKHINLAQEEHAVRLGVQTIDDYGAMLQTAGFPQEDALVLVQSLQAQLDSDAAARQNKAAVAAKLASKGVSLTKLEAAVRAGVSTLDDYRAALASAGYDAAAQETMVSLLQLQMTQDQAALAAHGTASALLGQRGVSLTDLERAVKLGVVAIAVYTDALTRAGLQPSDVQTLTLSLAAQIKAQKKAQTTGAAADAVLKQAGLSLATLEKNTLAGLLTLAQLTTTLTGAGVSADQVAAILAVVQDELANQAAMVALAAGATARAKAKGLDLAQEVAAVKAGVKTLVDFEQLAASLGYDPADVATLVATLGVQLQAKAAKTPVAKAP